MKFAVCALVFSLYASASLAGAIELTGFEIVKKSSQSMEINFQDEEKFVISKARFATESEATHFCQMNGAKLDTEFNALLFAMSGAANLNKFIKSAIVFKIDGGSGIISWGGRGDDSVVLMVDGHGTETQVAPMSELRKHTAIKNLHAICVR